MADFVSVWRAEIAAELAAATKELSAAVADLSAAEVAAEAARGDLAALNTAVQRAAVRAPLSVAISTRHRARIELLKQAGPAKLLRARNAVASAQDRAADLRRALGELDVIAPPQQAEAAAA